MSKVKALLNNYVNISDPVVESTIVQAAVGCPRAVQYVLLLLHENAVQYSGSGRPIHNWATPNDLINAAQAAWAGSGRGSFLTTTQKHADTALSAFLSLLYAPALSRAATSRESPFTLTRRTIPADTEDDTPVYVGVFDAETSVPVSWLLAAREGVLRLQYETRGTDDANGSVVVFPPYPFLERYIGRYSTCKLNIVDCIETLRRSEVLSKAMGSTGRGKAFETAVALEVCMPTSPLLQQICSLKELLPFKLRPFWADMSPTRIQAN